MPSSLTALEGALDFLADQVDRGLRGTPGGSVASCLVQEPVTPSAGAGNRSRGAEIVDGATVSVAVVASRSEAELIVGLLRSHGLRAAVAADDAGGQEPQLQLQGVRVLVARSDEASARRLLAEADDTPS